MLEGAETHGSYRSTKPFIKRRCCHEEIVLSARDWSFTEMLVSSACADDFGIPIVYGATVDANANTLTLTGVHLGQSPTVTLGGVLPLTVQSSSGTQIVASLPPTLAPGSYLIFAKFSNFTVAVFEATVGAVGPRGPQGAQGPTGSPGAQGP